MYRNNNVSTAETQYINELYKIPILTDIEEKMLFNTYNQTHDSEIRKKIIEHNLRLVVSIAKTYLRFNIPFLDIIQLGNLALIKAVDNFDINRGNKFSSYASKVIKTSIDREVIKNYFDINVPEYLYYINLKIINVIEDFKNKYGYEPSNEYLSEVIGESVDRIERARDLSIFTRSLNETIGNDEDKNELIDIIKDSKSDSFEESTILKNDIETILEVLSDREKEIIIKRFGLFEIPNETYVTIAKSLGLTSARIPQIEEKALLKLKQRGYRKGIYKEYL